MWTGVGGRTKFTVLHEMTNSLIFSNISQYWTLGTLSISPLHKKINVRRFVWNFLEEGWIAGPWSYTNVIYHFIATSYTYCGESSDLFLHKIPIWVAKWISQSWGVFWCFVRSDRSTPNWSLWVKTRMFAWK